MVIHHMMSVIGGFFGLYALLLRGSTFGSSETSNLIYLTVAGLSGQSTEFLIRLFALICYILGIILATIFENRFSLKKRYLASIFLDLGCCVILAFIPESANPIMALYPMFFVTAFQYITIYKLEEFNSAAVYSTNNLRQCFAGLTNYLFKKNSTERRRFLLFGRSLLFFHLGVILAYFGLRHFSLSGIYLCIPWLLLCAVVAYKTEF